MAPAIEVTTGDLLQQRVDAIVNPWNRNLIPWWLLLPQGVSGAIKRAAGYEPFRQLAKSGPLKSGSAVMTTAGRLPFRAIVHVAGLTIFWRSSESLVRQCVRAAMRAVDEHQIASVAFPLIGAGTGGLDPDQVEKAIVDEASQSTYSGRVVVVRYVPAG